VEGVAADLPVEVEGGLVAVARAEDGQRGGRREGLLVRGRDEPPARVPREEGVAGLEVHDEHAPVGVGEGGVVEEGVEARGEVVRGGGARGAGRREGVRAEGGEGDEEGEGTEPPSRIPPLSRAPTHSSSPRASAWGAAISGSGVARRSYT